MPLVEEVLVLDRASSYIGVMIDEYNFQGSYRALPYDDVQGRVQTSFNDRTMLIRD